MMQLTVEGARAITRAALEVGEGAFVCGPNGAGKSTIATCLAHLLTGTAKAGLTKDERAARMVRDGCQAAAYSLKGPDWSVRIVQPDGEVALTGDPMHASKIAAQLVVPAQLPPKERSAALIEALKAEPTAAEWSAACKEAAVDSSKAWKLIEQHGWDAAVKKLSDDGKAAKGAWCQITKRRAYASKEAETWQPEGWETQDLMSLDVLALEQAHDAAQAERDRVIADNAVAAAERKRLAAWAQATPPDLEEARKAAELAAAKAESDHERLTKVAVHLAACPCPHCGAPVEIWPENDPGGLPLRKPRPVPTVDKGTAEKWKAEAKASRLAADEALKRLQEVEEANRKHEEALARLAELPEVDDTAMAEAKRRVDEAQRILDAVAATREARERHQEILALAKLVHLAGPQGVRQDKLAATMGLLRSRLDAVCTSAGWPVVELDEAMEITAGGRSYKALSESERWRCDAAIAMAVGSLDGSVLCILDGADVLDSAGRNGLIKGMRDLSLRAVVCMTLPRLQSRVLAGAVPVPVYWVADGTATLVEVQQEARAAA